jgi:DNA-binding transcriptional LysR family regulator
MTDIPVELLRTFIEVCDRKSFTRAAEALKRSQPAISLQMKRLESMVGAPLFRRIQGVLALTAEGDTLVSYARRILSLNDEMIRRLARPDAEDRVRIGLPNHFAEAILPRALARFASAYKTIPVDVVANFSGELILRRNEMNLDIMVALQADTPREADKTWVVPVTWVAAPDWKRPADGLPVPVVAFPLGRGRPNAIADMFRRAGQSFTIVSHATTLSGGLAAVHAGMGICSLASCAVPFGLAAVDRSQGLPDLPDFRLGLFVRTGTTAAAQHLADCLSAEIDLALASVA